MLEAFVVGQIIFISLLGFSRFLHLLFKTQFKELSLFANFVLGFSFLSFLNLLLNFFIPINTFVSTSLILIGSSSFLFYLKDFKSNLKELIFFELIFICLCVAGQIVPFPYDKALYHLQTTKWITEEAIPIGIVNLHERLAFNSISFLTSATFSSLGIKAIYVFNNVFYACFFSFLIHFALKYRSAWALLIFIFFTFSPYTRHFIYENTSSTGNDFFATLLFIHVLLTLFQQTAFKKFILLECALIGTIKITGLSVFLFASFFLFFTPRRVVIYSIVFFFLWVLRNIFLSSCLVYPLSFTCISSLDWAPPLQEIQITQLIHEAWAKWPYKDYQVVLSSWDWLQPWFEEWKSIRATKYLEYMVGVSIFIIIIRRCFYKYKMPTKNYTFLSLSLIGVLIWFLKYPDIRFGLGPIIVFCTFLLFCSLENLVSLNFYKLVAYISLLIFVKASIEIPKVANKEMTWLKSRPIEESYTFEKNIETGIYYAKSGEQCDYSPLPCARNFEASNKVSVQKLKNYWYYFKRK